MIAQLKSGVSLTALRLAMPPRDLEREMALTAAANKIVDAAKLARQSLKEQADG